MVTQVSNVIFPDENPGLRCRIKYDSLLDARGWKFFEFFVRPRVVKGKARFKRRTLHVPNLMQMRKIYCFRSFALDSAHVKVRSLKRA